MEHTPGPWETCQGRRKHREARFITAGFDRYVGKVYGHDDQPVEANARLIAAAPDLLAACEAALQALLTMPSSYGQDQIEVPALEAALAKARGEA